MKLLAAPGEWGVACLGVWTIVAQTACDHTVLPALDLTLLFCTKVAPVTPLSVLVSSHCKGGLRYGCELLSEEQDPMAEVNPTGLS